MAESYEELKATVTERADFIATNPHQLHARNFGSEVLGLLDQAFELGRRSGRTESSFAPTPEPAKQLDLDDYAAAEELARQAVEAAFEEPELDLDLKESA